MKEDLAERIFYGEEPRLHEEPRLQTEEAAS